MSRLRAGGFLAAGLLLSTSFGWPQKLSQAEEEEFLRTGKVVERHNLGKGVTNSVRLTLEKDGFQHDAHLQTIDETKTQFEGSRGTEMNFRDSWKFNVAAYELGKLLGIDDMIPPSVERKDRGSTGAYTWWVDDILMDETKRLHDKIQPPDPERWNNQMFVVHVFDQLIYNTDRNLGNLIINKDWKIWMIDHTRAFRIRRDLREAKNLKKCDRGLLAKLRELNKDGIKKAMGKYVTGMEIDGLLARRDRIVKFFDDEVKTKGEGAVLYDRPVIQ